MSEPWLPSDEEIERVRALLDIGALRALIRSAVEKALAEERSKHGNDTLRAKVETLDFAINAYEQEKKEVEARHARELERAKLEARASALAWAHDRGSWPAVQAEWRRAHEALAALDKERKP